MREWHLTAADPMAPRIAADARNGRTNYTDDQVWQLRLGKPDEPAISLETRYGGRVGLARILPIWIVGRRQIYEAQGYHHPPILIGFAPDLLRLRADLTLNLKLIIEFWAMESQAVGGGFICRNTGSQPETFRLDLIAQAMREREDIKMMFLTLEGGQTALQLGKMGNLEPILLLEGATETGTSARLGRTVTLEPGAEMAIRWVLGAMPNRDASLQLAFRWLTQTDWNAHIAVIEKRANAQPEIETGHADWDAALAWSQQLILRSFLAATGNLPNPSFVTSRRTNQGYAVGGVHTGGFNTSWSGQTVTDALLIAPTVALAAPQIAQGIVRNFLAVQRDDGWIDAKPGLDGQRVNVLAPPLLATLAYTVYHYTRDKTFLDDCFDGLMAFFYRWFKPDMDRDRDGLPEWSIADQGAFGEGPTFAQNRRWSQGADITTVEAPDLAAYLLREVSMLIKIAQVLERDNRVQELTPHQEALQTVMNTMWDADRGVFYYRDRETHTCPHGEMVYEAKGDQPLRERTKLANASRLILRVIGGLSHKPKVGCTIEGIKGDGKPGNETIPGSAFDWYRGMGSATTSTVWREITNLKFDGLSRVYTVQVSTVDLSRHDQALFMPLWTNDLEPAQAKQMMTMLTDPAQYWREYGISGCPATDPAYDPSHQNGCGGVWPRWNVLLAWALLDRGYISEAADLFKRLLAAQIRSLATDQAFRAFYNPDTGEGLGEGDTISGVVSLVWFARLFGGYVLAPDTVVLSGPFAFEGEKMTWTQHGVRFERRTDGSTIRFPSGKEIKLPPDAEPQVVRDPSRPKAARKPPKSKPAAPQSPALTSEDDPLPEVD